MQVFWSFGGRQGDSYSSVPAVEDQVSNNLLSFPLLLMVIPPHSEPIAAIL